MYFSLDDFEFEEFDENLEDASGRTYEKSQFMAALVNEEFDGIIGMANCSNFLLTGPAGSGKSYLANCFAQTAKEDDYEVYQIDCEDIMEEDDPQEVWKGIFEEVIKKTDPDGDYDQKVFLYLENLDAVKENRKCVRVIASSLKEISNVDCKCIIVSTDLTGTAVPSSILKQFSIIELDKPDEDARRDFFKGLLKIKLENEEDEDDVTVFYPLATGSKETQESNVKFDELNVLSLYCAEKTDGLTFGQLQIVLNQLNRQLKVTLQRITDNDADAIKAHVEHGKGYVVTEEEFLQIIAKVRKGASILAQAENMEKSGGNSGVTSVQPQVVYTQPVMMQGIPMAGGYPMQGGYPGTVPTNPEDAKLDFVKQVAEDDNPMVKDLDIVYGMAVQSVESKNSDMGGLV